MLKRRHPDNLLVALDIGTTKTCAAAVTITEKAIEIAGFTACSTKGIRKGQIVDINGVAHSIGKALEGLQEEISEPVSRAVVGLPASHIQIIESSGIAPIRRGEVTEADISRSIESALSIAVSASLERLHVIPLGFKVDGMGGIKNPLAMSGSRLEAKVAILNTDTQVVNNILKACQNVDLDVESFILQPLACAESVLTNEERERGVVLIDIGGGKTEISIFTDGAFRWATSLPIGGTHFTNDMAIGLKLPFNEAERIKKLVNLASGPPYELEAFGIDGQIEKVSAQDLEDILYPRAEELFDLIKRQVEGYHSDDPLLSAVISGGGSQLSGLNHIAESVLAISVRTGFPHIREDLYSSNVSLDMAYDELRQPGYSVLVGLLLYSVDKYLSQRGDSKGGVFRRLIKGLKGLFWGKV